MPYVTCFLAVGDVVYLIYDRGFAACIDAPTGKVRWLERTDGNFSGSPVLAGDKIYCIDEDGVVWVFAADPDKYRLLAKTPRRSQSLHARHRWRQDVSANHQPTILHRRQTGSGGAVAY